MGNFCDSLRRSFLDEDLVQPTPRSGGTTSFNVIVMDDPLNFFTEKQLLILIVDDENLLLNNSKGFTLKKYSYQTQFQSWSFNGSDSSFSLLTTDGKTVFRLPNFDKAAEIDKAIKKSLTKLKAQMDLEKKALRSTPRMKSIDRSKSRFNIEEKKEEKEIDLKEEKDVKEKKKGEENNEPPKDHILSIDIPS